MAEPIGIQFGVLSQVGPRSHVLNGGSGPLSKRGRQFWGLFAPLKCSGSLLWCAQKNGKHVLYGVKVGRIHLLPRGVTTFSSWMSPAETAEPLDVLLWGLTPCGPKEPWLCGVKVVQIHLLPRGVTRWLSWHTGELCKNR